MVIFSFRVMIRVRVIVRARARDRAKGGLHLGLRSWVLGCTLLSSEDLGLELCLQ